ncbi:GIY-YIG nuclease family protein [Terricaulis silvestris]|uniref:GIY-YIG nuclease superfamily protein n=1 Tax=Terricaulis silvestris TaxID=2686094 RepID=A0A6I6MHD7_9CAUL|nr:GIY-YIG nuclease family protein [Terricaulis silvestris]QGZ94275.1 GIY-YIG nuclease superfamily protein [Terricaulis silvestris]
MREEAGGYVYILASKRNGTLYTGSARNLISRAEQHREGSYGGFTRKIRRDASRWFEAHSSIASAYRREQLIKRWKRAWKISSIEENNSRWDDLFEALSQQTLHPSLPGRVPRAGGAESRDP